MYCQNCGREIGNAKYCPICGSVQPDYDPEPMETAPAGPAIERVYDNYNGQIRDDRVSAPGAYRTGRIEDKYRAAFRDPMYLAITLIITVTTILSIFVGTKSGVYGNIRVAVAGVSITASVFPILFTIALWIIFGAVRGKGRLGTTGYAMASGTLKAIRIVLWVLFGLFIALLLLMIVFGSIQLSRYGVSLSAFLEELNYEIGRSIPDIDIPGVAGAIAAGWIVAVVIITLIIGIAAFIIMIICYKKLHNFAKSVCVSLKTGMENYRSARGARSWLIVLAIFSFIGAFFSVFSLRTTANILSLISFLLTGIAEILAAIMIKTHFLSNTDY